ncbi:DUF6069 family protein [Actinomadura kijaniata]|uniref:DUF6069 family protein n=1 Tax=Actinomadura kijaniata TaxID=46161 RepID=UPI00082A4C44|nr:hypothetical protein [Actinomadura kijaniata]
MAETPFEPFFDGGSAEPRRERSLGPRYGRSFRCRSAARRDLCAERFIALHEAAADDPAADLRRVWGGGLLTAAGAGGLAALVAVIARGTAELPFPAFLTAEAGPGAAGFAYGVCATAATLQATALLHVLLTTAARPVRAFCWIGGIVVVLLTLLPLTLHAPLDAVLLTSGINAVGGSGVVALLAAVARAARDGFP